MLATNEQFFSSACIEQVLTNNIECSPLTPCIKHILQYTTAPILISTTPKTSILAVEENPLEYKFYLAYASLFESLFSTACSTVFNHPRLRFVNQPTETLATPYCTKIDYLNKACFEKHHDYWHKTPSYGKAVLTKIIAQLSALSV